MAEQIDVGALVKRLKELEREQGVLRTLKRCAYYLDYVQEAEWLDCYTEDAAYEVRVVIPGAKRTRVEPRRFQGRKALAEWISHHVRPPERYFKHYVQDADIEVKSEGRVVVTSYWARIDGEHDGTAWVKGFGRYFDTLRLCPDGVWRIEERIAEVEALVETR